ncbi:hypothetical protein KL771_06910 [Hyphomicrobiaceae bacterium 22]|uniref:DUF4276 family protein n=1 Tax=Prosthecodimorpha staleyi TaxID=2840188 RepID=A0A947GIA5_9HYPH|nr:hypothetical protein [Prosthecodimorpha staleyi]
MADPAFIVEGKQEKLVINRICPGKRVILLGINNSDVEMKAIATRIYAHFQNLGNRHHPVVVIFDREKRNKSCDSLNTELRFHLNKLGIKEDQLIICIADRSLESWIAPFLQDDGSINTNLVPQKNYEGIVCESIIIRQLRKANIDYDKTTVGVDLFCSISPKKLAEISPSFSQLRKALLDICHWMNM